MHICHNPPLESPQGGSLDPPSAQSIPAPDEGVAPPAPGSAVAGGRPAASVSSHEC